MMKRRIYIIYSCYLLVYHISQCEHFNKLHRFPRQFLSNATFANASNSTSIFLGPSGSFSTGLPVTSTYIITSFTYIESSPTFSMQSEEINVVLSYNPDTCLSPNLVQTFEGNCLTKPNAQAYAASALRGGLNNPIDIASSLTLYMNSMSNDSKYLLTIHEIDRIVNQFGYFPLITNTNQSYLMNQKPNRGNNISLLGASFQRGVGGQMVNTSNEKDIMKSPLSAAAILNKDSLENVASLSMLIIDNPVEFEHVDNSNEKKLASSIIVINVQRNKPASNSLMLTLKFRPWIKHESIENGKYLCSFYDSYTSTWNESGCNEPRYNSTYERYECNCNHLTSFALIWLPRLLVDTRQLSAQDITSLIFQLFSIVCFILIIIHAITMRIIDRTKSIPALNLLPLISMACTTILFIFFISLTLTVYVHTSSKDQLKCFTSSSVLMFITYFSIIFMFCIKTSVGYFYYQRFVRLFPQPSYRKLLIMIIISCFVSIICVIIAIGLNTKSTYNIVQLYPYRLCWFTRHVIHYFLTIPIGIFLFLNIISIILVFLSLIKHVCHAPTAEQKNERWRRAVVILLSSCITQGVGWLFGLIIPFVNSSIGNVFGWLFNIFNGLEGVWSIMLYIVIRLKRLDEQKHVRAAFELTNSSSINQNKKQKKYSNSIHIDSF